MSEAMSMTAESFGEEEHGYEAFLQSVRDRFDSFTSLQVPLFRTNTDELFPIFLYNLPESARQHYTCHACRHFFNHFGNLVMVNEDGSLDSVLWDEQSAPPFFKNAVVALRRAVLRSKIQSVFKTSQSVLGYPVTGVWHHFSVQVPDAMRHQSRLNTPEQVSAEKSEDRKMLLNALTEYSIATIEQAVTILQREALYRSEKTLGVAEWFLDIKKKFEAKKNKDNLIWLAVATAPAGFCHVRSSMIGTLLDDIESGMAFEAIKRRFELKMNPLQYQRPQAAPTIGNIAQAEKIVEKLGIQNSLRRRFARLAEIETIWCPEPTTETKESSGVFGHLVPKGEESRSSLVLPPTTMTWRKFEETVLPNATEIEYKVPFTDNFTAILTAADMDAPPILQWDREDRRNPFSWYVYNGGAQATRWNLQEGYVPVMAITLQPSMWHQDNEHQGKGLILVLQGAKDLHYHGAGNALFPETLKSELREIRSTIEAYSQKAVIEGAEEASACGVRLQYGTPWSATVRVTTSTGKSVYKLDRWD